ncbi:hypothetical protein [Butyrivibrio sp. WCD3002]|uniref:hypothetical protein n=1 Tax=Butyrivibrio sp. WCD3002 TaxID=1280676 RepID=UPI00040102C9|nr:hypothetical protein [Butyrivibrio sp. WCD3002]
MRLYHGSNVLGLNVLEPRLADHDRPYVYMTTIDAVAALYLCNAVEKPYYWFPYGFDETGNIPVYHELYPNALREVSEGVSGCIYVVDANDDQYIKFKNIPCARLGIVPIEVADAIIVDNAYDFIQNYIRQGKLKVSRYEDKTSDQLNKWHTRFDTPIILSEPTAFWGCGFHLCKINLDEIDKEEEAIGGSFHG